MKSFLKSGTFIIIWVLILAVASSFKIISVEALVLISISLTWLVWEKFFKAIFTEQQLTATIFLNSKFRIIFCNSHASTLFKCSKLSFKIFGKDCENEQKIKTALKNIKQNKKKKILSLQDKRGKYFYGKLGLQAYRVFGQEFYKVIIVDVSEEEVLIRALKAEVQEIAEMQTELTDLSKQRNEFLNFVAHELKTPLTSIRMSTALLKKHPKLSKKQKEGFTNTLWKECLRLEKMIDNILDFSRIESGTFALKRKNCNLQTIIQQVEKWHKDKLRDREMNLDVSLNPELEQVFLDEKRILQLFDNIIDNSIRNGKKGSHIVVEANKVNDNIQISISNEGVLLPDDRKEDIFEKYFCATDVRGAGIGLFVVREIVKAHNGTIVVEDNFDKFQKPCGVIFKILLRQSRDLLVAGRKYA